MLRLRFALLLVPALVLATTARAAVAAPDRDATASLPGRIYDVRAHRFIDTATLIARIAPVRYRLLGEIHDNPAHHRARADLIAAIVRTGQRPAVVLEQLEIAKDAALADAQRRGGATEAIADAGGLDRRAWRWPLHAPVIDAARTAGLPLHGGGVPSSALQDGRRDAETEARLVASAWGEREEAALRSTIEDSHCGQLPAAAVPRMAEAQRWRDAAMADAVVRAATRDGSILIAGNGHVRRDLGVPRYLPPGDVVSVGFVEAATAQPADDATFDFVWYTEEAPRDDPCAAFAVPRAR